MRRICLLAVGLVMLAGCADDPSADPNLGTETIADCMIDQLEETIDEVGGQVSRIKGDIDSAVDDARSAIDDEDLDSAAVAVESIDTSGLNVIQADLFNAVDNADRNCGPADEAPVPGE